MLDRRAFLETLTAATGAAWLKQHPAPATGPPDDPPYLACNEYTWFTFYQREGRAWDADLDASLEAFASSGLRGYEPSIDAPEELEALGPLLKKHGLEMRSLYVNSKLHERAEADQSIASVLAIAAAAKPLGARLVVTNPSPIRWGGPEDKSDAQLEVQAAALDRLGAALRGQGLTLAYHNHDPELRNAAREFHHMMLHTDPANVTFCLDAHWIYRGSGNSQVALFDVMKLYGKRITEVHLRQSKAGVWTETLGPGDIDYPRLAQTLLQLGVRPHLVLEQAVEEGTPETMGAVEAHHASLQYAAEVFEALLS